MPRGVDLPGVMITLVVAGVVGFVGLQVMDQVVETADLDEGNFNESATDLENAFDSAFGLIGVAFIVIILAVIIVYLYGLRGNGGM